jgi:flagellar export protein FliJ
MPYHFPLEAVLRLRRSQERMERLKLEAILSEHARTSAFLDQVTEQFFESRRRFQTDMGGTVAGSELQFEAVRAAEVSAMRLSLRGRLVELDRHRSAQLQLYLKARQRREILENLRHRKLIVYRVEQSRHEQQELEDLFLMRSEHLTDEKE